MSRYSGMSVENSIAAYQQDSGDEQKAQAECEEMAALITDRNLSDLITFGKAKLASGITMNIAEIMACVDNEFFACEMIDLDNYFVNKETFMPSMIAKAVKKAESFIYKTNFNALVKS